jgi:hypothetical protein
MTETFDPYYRWLGISPKDQPPNHYRLLGLELFESDPRVIDSIASRHIDYLQEITDGPHVREAQRLLNELAAARRCLLDPRRKAAYDAELNDRLASPCERHGETAGPSSPVELPTIDASVRTNRAAGRSRKTGKTTAARRRPLVVWAVTCAVMALALVAIVVWFFAGDDENGLGDASKSNTDQESDPPESRSATTAGLDEEAASQTGPVFEDGPDVDRHAAGSSADDLPGSPPIPEAEPAQSENAGAVAPVWPQPVPSDGILLWLDASDSVSVELDEQGRIQRWRDRSGNASHAAADHTERCPLLVPDTLAGRPVARFSGAACLEVPGSSSFLRTADAYTIVFVARGHQGTLLSKGTGETEGSLAIADGTSGIRAGGRELSARTDRPTEFRVRTVQSEPESLRWFVDGEDCGTCAEATGAVTSRSRLRIGCVLRSGQGEASFFVGDLAELIVYGRPLEDQERAELEEHLKKKWLTGASAPFPFELERAVEDPPPDLVAGDSVENTEEPELDTAPPAADAVAADPAQPPVADADGEPAADDAPFTLHVNLGGDSWRDPEGNSWVESKAFDGATFGHEGGLPVKTDVVPNPVARTARRGLTNFRAVVPNGVFAVSLYFSEHWTTSPQRRVFSVFVEQQPVQRPVNIFRAPGLGAPYIHKIRRVAVNDGRLDVDFFAATEDSSAILNGISIRQLK